MLKMYCMLYSAMLFIYTVQSDCKTKYIKLIILDIFIFKSYK